MDELINAFPLIVASAIFIVYAVILLNLPGSKHKQRSGDRDTSSPKS